MVIGYQYCKCLRLVPDCREPISMRESGTKDYYGLRLVPDCRKPISMRESGTNIGGQSSKVGTRLPQAYKHAGVGYQSSYSEKYKYVPYV